MNLMVGFAAGPSGERLTYEECITPRAARGRHVVRYDLRDAGASTTVDPEAPAQTLRDPATDAAVLAHGLDD